jgi:6-pyruvoyltetrahydropterin/6-carboxytetrahydropterin synthase
MRVGRSFSFEAAHFLKGYRGGCASIHGHSYKLDVELEGPIQTDGPEIGMVCDFKRLDKIVKEVIKEWDHAIIVQDNKDLAELDKIPDIARNIILLGSRPTAENMVMWIYRYCENEGLPVYSVKLWETADSYAIKVRGGA